MVTLRGVPEKKQETQCFGCWPQENIVETDFIRSEEQMIPRIKHQNALSSCEGSFLCHVCPDILPGWYRSTC